MEKVPDVKLEITAFLILIVNNKTKLRYLKNTNLYKKAFI